MDFGRRRLAGGEEPFQGPMAYSFGFQLQTRQLPFGPPPDAFGHLGAGGSVHGAWPSEDVGFSYVMNQLRSPDADRRARDVLDALHGVLQRG
jgi:CubicO group peptidase (beta-lactamase class C family)